MLLYRHWARVGVFEALNVEMIVQQKRTMVRAIAAADLLVTKLPLTTNPHTLGRLRRDLDILGTTGLEAYDIVAEAVEKQLAGMAIQ